MSGAHWVTEPDAQINIKIDQSGFGSIAAKTIVQVFRETVRKHGDRNAMAFKAKVDGKVSEQWKFWTFKQYWDDCITFGKALVHLKVDPYKIVNILGFNAPEWFIASNGAILAGCIGAGIYVTNTAEACQYISEHSKAEIVVVEGNAQLKKYLNFTTTTLPHLKAIVVYGEDVDSALVSKCAFPVYSWGNFMALGSGIATEAVDARGAAVSPGNCASLIYTSGTTGPPKAVMISHDNLCWTAHNVMENSWLKQQIGAWAKSKGFQRAQMVQYGGPGGAPCCFGLANSLVLSKVKEALGLDQARVCFTAAAPIAVETLNYFASLDVHIYEVFGQSECTGPHTFSSTHCWKIGSCGRPMKGTVSKIDKTTGELCYRGRHVFMGYMYMPDKTAETIDEDGFLHSGDVAAFDDDSDPDLKEGPGGFMRITGRIKELIVTAGGENVPPVLIENEMKAEMPAISNCMVIGDKRKFLSMLVSLKVNPEADGRPSDNLTADSLFVGEQIGSSATTYSAAKEDPKWKEYIDKGMKAANARTTSNAQIVQKWVWLPVDFSEKAGDLTPTLKLKRSVVADNNRDLIDSIYA